jgi:hypothetical protein
MDPLPSAEVAYPIALADQHLRACGVRPEHSVTLAGRKGLDAQLWLCRHRYETVNHVTGDRYAERADVVLLTDQIAPEEVEAAVRRARRLLAAGGWLVTWSKDARQTEDPVHGVLVAAGFELARCVRQDGGELHLARARCVDRLAA